MDDRIAWLPDDAHVFRMTDDTGMLQHARYAVPDPSEGYTTDDNARALIMATMLYEATKSGKYLALAYRYLSFLLYAQENAWFRNFMSYGRRFQEKEGSPDCFGRCVWALGFTAACAGLPRRLRRAAEFLLKKAMPGCRRLGYLRSKAYAAEGLGCCTDDAARGELRILAADIAAAYDRNRADGWHWYEDALTYGNAVMPGAMFTAYEVLREPRYRTIAAESLDFLLDQTFRGDVFRPVGCSGWLRKGTPAAEFDQQPVEACGTLLACLKAGRLTGKPAYIDRARDCLEWFMGKNILGKLLVDPDTGGCMDGLTPAGCNENQGAESLVAWIVASLAFHAANPK